MADPVVFAEVCPLNENGDVERMFLDLRTRQWRLALFSLYLRIAKPIPRLAKVTTGASFGFCDAEGRQVPRAQATHCGWTLDEGEVPRG